MAELIVLAFWIASLVAMFYLGHDIGRRTGHADTSGQCEMAERLASAVDDLDKWCGASSPHARLIARHLTAHGLGQSLNAGTPCGDEPCTIAGLREQLRRLDAAPSGA